MSHFANYVQSSSAKRSIVNGSKIMVEGMIDYRQLKNKEGKMIYRTHIKATSLITLDR